MGLYHYMAVSGAIREESIMLGGCESVMGECSRQAHKASAAVGPCDIMISLSFEAPLKFGPFDIIFVWFVCEQAIGAV
jgi:hypothetical protein